MEAGDVVTRIDGQKIVTSPDFIGKLGQHRPGDVLRFEIVRDGKKKETTVKLSDSRTGTLGAISSAKAPDDMLLDLGMAIRDLNPVEESRLPKDGVIVSAIQRGSQIAGANMEEKFIITRINGIPVSNVDEFKKQLKQSGSALYLQGYYEEYPGDFAYSLALK